MNSSPASLPTDASILTALISAFIGQCRSPVLLEPGEDPVALLPGQFQLAADRHGRVLLEAWNERTTVARRIVKAEEHTHGKLTLQVECFPKRTGRITLLDAGRPQSGPRLRQRARDAFRERFRRFLQRQFTGARLVELSSETDLEHSLSPVYPRALLRTPQGFWAAMGAADRDSADGLLAFGLIWLDYLRRREAGRAVEGLILLVPQEGETATQLRLACLDATKAHYRLFMFADDEEAEVDLTDRGNLKTRLEPLTGAVVSIPAPYSAAVSRWRQLPFVQAVEGPLGTVSFRVQGLEFARWTGSRLLCGLDRREPAQAADLPAVERVAAELARHRQAGADPGHPLYHRHPERWLEAQVRAQLATLDATLHPSPLYGQVPAYCSRESGLIDLLAVDEAGRLAVLELKTKEDLQLPVQALDYWMRVQWHAARGEFTERGYFPGHALCGTAPRLLLVAPALDWHPSTEVLLRAFSPAIDVERIGLAAHWQRELAVLFRWRGVP